MATPAVSRSVQCAQLYCTRGSTAGRALKQILAVLGSLQGGRLIQLESMYFVYVLLCGDGDHYTGYTTNVEDRLLRHQRREVFSTKGRQPVELIFYEAFAHMADAKRREAYLKTSAGKRALKIMLREYFSKAGMLARP